MDAARRSNGVERTLRTIAIGGLFVLLIVALQDILLLVFAAILIACALRGFSNALHRRSGLSEGWALAAVLCVGCGTLAALVWWRGPAIADETTQAARQLVVEARRFWAQIEQSAWGPLFSQQLEGVARALKTGLGGYATGVAGSVLGLGGTLVVIIATALFFASSPQTYVTGGLRLLPVGWRPRGREIADEIARTLQLWTLGQLLDMLVVTTLVGVGLYALDVPLAPTLALFAGALNFVPYVGALAGAFPAVLMALGQSPTQAVYVAILFLCVQTLEGNVIAPMIQKRTISLPPALTILSQTIFGTLFGLFGLVVATPLVAALMTLVRMAYVESVLEGAQAASPPSEARGSASVQIAHPPPG